jgi:signal recognition particle receptor subunit beta
MTFVNMAAREIYTKIVYYGPGLSGKTTNVRHIYERTAPACKGKLVSLQTESERTLFFDFLPLDLGKVNGFKMRFQLYTVPGQIFYGATRKLVLKGFDAIVFVADSQPERLEANIEAMEDLHENLIEHGRDPAEVPVVVQYNKRDLDDVLSIAELRAALNPRGALDFEAAASTGRGVFETLKGVSTLALKRLSAEMPRRTSSGVG